MLATVACKVSQTTGEDPPQTDLEPSFSGSSTQRGDIASGFGGSNDRHRGPSINAIVAVNISDATRKTGVSWW